MEGETATWVCPGRWPVSYCRELSSYAIPFLGSDVSVVKRTQRYLYENLEQSPVSILFFSKECSVCYSSPTV